MKFFVCSISYAFMYWFLKWMLESENWLNGSPNDAMKLTDVARSFSYCVQLVDFRSKKNVRIPNDLPSILRISNDSMPHSTPSSFFDGLIDWSHDWLIWHVRRFASVSPSSALFSPSSLATPHNAKLLRDVAEKDFYLSPPVQTYVETGKDSDRVAILNLS